MPQWWPPSCLLSMNGEVKPTPNEMKQECSAGQGPRCLGRKPLRSEKTSWKEISMGTD